MSIVKIPWASQQNQYLITGPMTGPKSYIPHSHSGGEIYLHISGDVEYIVEDVIYQPKPYDLIIAREQEMHYLNCKSSVFERIVIEISDCFFLHQQRELYRAIFCKPGTGYGNLIPAATVKSMGIYNAVIRAVHYLQDKDPAASVAVLSTLAELIFLIHKAGNADTGSFVASETVREIIAYLNRNITTSISLDDIANYFYISKPHLCRIFKINTGLTIHAYITNRRISLVEQLVLQDEKSFSQACRDAGFGSYSNFYKAYVKKTGKSPREKLLNINRV